MKTISAADIHDISVGSVFLATGGGGDPWVSRMLAEQVLTDHGPVRLIGPKPCRMGHALLRSVALARQPLASSSCLR